MRSSPSETRGVVATASAGDETVLRKESSRPPFFCRGNAAPRLLPSSVASAPPRGEGAGDAPGAAGEPRPSSTLSSQRSASKASSVAAGMPCATAASAGDSILGVVAAPECEKKHATVRERLNGL